MKGWAVKHVQPRGLFMSNLISFLGSLDDVCFYFRDWKDDCHDSSQKPGQKWEIHGFNTRYGYVNDSVYQKYFSIHTQIFLVLNMCNGNPQVYVFSDTYSTFTNAFFQQGFCSQSDGPFFQLCGRAHTIGWKVRHLYAGVLLLFGQSHERVRTAVPEYLCYLREVGLQLARPISTSLPVIPQNVQQVCCLQLVCSYNYFSHSDPSPSVSDWLVKQYSIKVRPI